MKEDILEQIVDDWLISQTGTFTKHNVKYRPSRSHANYKKQTDDVHSDIDILAVNPNKRGVERVTAVTCKSWQGGFNAKGFFDGLLNTPNKKVSGRPLWKNFRELSLPKWGNAYAQKIFDETNSKDFTYIIAVTKFSGRKPDEFKSKIESYAPFSDNLKLDSSSQVKIRFVTLKEMLNDYLQRSGTTPSSTQVGRLIQVMKAAGIKF